MVRFIIRGPILDDWLIGILDIDRLQLLKQNIEQMIGVVSATYGDSHFTTPATADMCTRPLSDVEYIRCRWTEIQRLDADNALDYAYQINASTEVRVMFYTP